MPITLNIKEIRDLAYAAGLYVSASTIDRDDMDVELTIEHTPKLPVLDEDDGDERHYRHIAFFTEHREEGCIPLGDEISSP